MSIKIGLWIAEPDTDDVALAVPGELSEIMRITAGFIDEYTANCRTKGMADEALASLDQAVELIRQSADKLRQAAHDYQRVYAGVRETAASGTQIIGDEQAVAYWSEVGGG